MSQAIRIALMVLIVALVAGGSMAVGMPRGRRRQRAERLATSGSRAIGTVVRSEIRERSSTDRGGGSRDVTHDRVESIAFDAAGRRIEGVPAEGDLPLDRDRTGQQVTVFYDPSRPGNFIAPVDGRALGGRSGSALIRWAVVVTLGCLLVTAVATFLVLR